mmetsp:Transcript_31167/g.51956  ORF Transcript_31167/g.51956 Transcript_31167/m.51956 type:complete len:131 (+) Transcript_31167:30-422(+)
MSHFTYMKTRFQNLSYLEKALNKLNITYSKQPTSSDLIQNNLTIAQSNGYNIEFCWNGKEYELVADLSFWIQPYPVESFIDKVAQNYANETVISESQKMGFQVANFQKNTDGSQILVLERWNSNLKNYGG